MDFFQQGLYPNCFGFFEPFILYLLFLMKSLDLPSAEQRTHGGLSKASLSLVAFIERDKNTQGPPPLALLQLTLVPGIFLPWILHLYCSELLTEGGKQLL